MKGICKGGSMKYCFGDIVVIENDFIGVVVKSWKGITDDQSNHDVYVRMYNSIKNYKEQDIERYMVRHKYLSKEEKGYQFNAINS